MDARRQKIDNIPRLHQVNQGIILQMLRRHAPMSPAELARRFGVPVGTIARLIQPLVAKGMLVTRRQSGPRSVGKPPTLVDLKSGFASFIGVELGSATTRTILVDFKGNLLASAMERTDKFLPAVNRRLPAYLAAFLKQYGAPKGNVPLGGVAMGVSGAVAPEKGRIVKSFLAADSELAPPIEDRLQAPVMVDNDANLAARAETAWGEARGVDHAVCVLDRGWVGAGLWLNGEIYRGWRNQAGELAADAWAEPGPPGARGTARFPFIGSFELEHLLRRRGLRGANGVCRADMVGALARRAPQSAAVRRLIEDVARDFARAFVRLADLFDPELMILAGDFAASGPYGELAFQEEFQRIYPAQTSIGKLPFPKVIFSRLDQNIVARGATAMIIDQVVARTIGGAN